MVPNRAAFVTQSDSDVAMVAVGNRRPVPAGFVQMDSDGCLEHQDWSTTVAGAGEDCHLRKTENESKRAILGRNRKNRQSYSSDHRQRTNARRKNI